MNVFKEFWVFNEGGLCLYNYSLQKNQDPALIGGFVTAITAFSENVNNTNIQSLNLGEHVILFSKDKQSKLLFVGRAKRIPNYFEYDQIMESIKGRFLHQFPCDCIKCWNGDTNKFSGFESSIQDFLQKYILPEK